jgi:aminobenzoyl-glutamate utilization protein B
MSRIPAEKQTAWDWITANEGRCSDFHQQIWHYAEPAWREYRSAAAYCDLLRSEGFEVEEGSGGMPTAFAATWGEGGPVLGIYAEYDAVPENSQAQVPYQQPREGLNRWAAGHTDPHSSLGTAALFGVLATKAAIERHGLRATLKLFGEPAEKVCGSKPVHAAKGYYDSLDAAIAYHPHPTNTTIWDTHCGPYWSCVFTFESLAPERWIDPSLLAHPGSSHAAARSPAALDAVCLMYTTTKYTKEAMYPHTGTWTLNEYIMVAGQCTSDNLPPRLAQIQYAWRTPNLAIAEQIERVLINNARAAAQATQTSVSIRWVTKTRLGLRNHQMAALAYANLETAGPPVYSAEAIDFARAVQQNLGLEQTENPFTEDSRRLTKPEEFEERQRQGLPSWQTGFTADDYVEYTWHAPTVRLHTSRPRLTPPGPGYAYPAWVNNALGGVRACIDPGMFLAGKAISGTFLDLILQPAFLQRARTEFEERTGGGIGGSSWQAPLLPRDFIAPVELRWPEYVQTVRGEEWWVPANTAEAAYTRL